MTDAHCFLFRTIKCQNCLIDMKIWSLQDKNDYLIKVDEIGDLWVFIQMLHQTHRVHLYELYSDP